MTPSRTRGLTAVVLVLVALSLVAAVGGASYAGALAKGVVGTAQLKKGAVTSAKVKDGSLTAADFAAGQLPAGPRGPAGPAGTTGERGPSDAWVTSLEGFGAQVDLTLLLPAGTYLATARADLFSATANSGSCQIGGTGTGHDFAYVAVPANREGSGYLQALVTLPVAGEVTFVCDAVGGLSWGRPSLAALAVGTGHLVEQPS